MAEIDTSTEFDDTEINFKAVKRRFVTLNQQRLQA